MAVISLITVGNGLKAAVNAQFGIESTQVITVQAGGLNFGAPGSTVVKSLTKQDAEAIDKLSTVEFVVPRNIELLQIEYNDKLSVTYGISVIEGLEDEMYSLVDIEAEFGRLLKTGDTRKIILGNNYLDGDKNGFGKDILPGKKLLIEGQSFEVVGILEKKGSFIFDNSLLMYDKDLNDLVGYGNQVDIIAVKVKSKDLISKAKEDIEKLLRERRDVKKGEEDFEVSTPEAALDQVNSVLNAIQIFVIIIASISIVVGAIGIVNTMATSVIEMKREIGIMKAIGARNTHIFMIFFVESGFLGLIGGLLGVIFGLLIGSFGIQAINNFIGTSTSVQFNIPLIIFSLIGSFLIGAIAGIVPAMNAARENPVEALRG